MKSFKQYLLEFDPNRGAPGRAKTLIPHLPDPEEVDLARKTVKNLRGSKSKYQKRYDSVSSRDKSRLDAFEAGKRGYRWQGTGYETEEEFYSQMVAHEAGRKMRLPREGVKRKLKDSIADNLIANTPAANLQKQMERQEDKIRSKRLGTALSIKGFGDRRDRMK